MTYVRYTGEMVGWLRENYPLMSNAEVMDAFEARFGVRPSPSGLASKCNALGIRKPRKEWTAEEVEWFVSYVPGHSEPEISAEHERLFGEPLTESQIGNAKTRYGVKSGTHGGRFQKGMVPYNKGRKWDEFMSPEGQARSLGTCYKEGNMPHNALDKPVGCERVDSKDGYVWVKVAERPSRQDCNDNWRLRHHLAWEEANGPVPPSTMIVFADHDKRNFDPNNLVAVPRDLWVRISQMRMEYHDRESLEACMMRARLHRAMGRKRRDVSCQRTS